MKELILGLTMIGLFVFAYFVVGRIDGFLKAAGRNAGVSQEKTNDVFVTFVDGKNAAETAERIKQLGSTSGSCAIIVCGAEDPEIMDYLGPEWHIEDFRYHIG